MASVRPVDGQLAKLDSRQDSMSIYGAPRSTRIHQSSSSQQDSSRNAPHLTLGNPGLTRHGTLLTSDATPTRAAAELKSILGNHNSRLKSKAALIRLDSGSAAFDRHVTLEQAKARARVEVDILPQTNIFVQGGHLRGHVKIFVRKAVHKEGSIFIAGGKIRVIGFESLGNKAQSIFYQCSAMLTSVTPSLDGLYASEPDTEGFALAKEGEHELPFALYLSLSNDHGQAKGFLRNYPGIALNYIVVVSLKIKDELGRRSIAHFYRSIEVWPRLDPTTILSAALRPMQATVSTNISKESDAGRIKLTASLYRLHWVAGQSCQVRIAVYNDTIRPLKRSTISLHRTITIFPQSSGGNLELGLGTRQPEVATRQVVESVLEAGQSRSRGHASAKGWWLGVPPQQKSEFEHSLLIPMDALTVPRGRIFEIEYSLLVAVDSGTRLSSDIQVILPIRIVSFHSIDPPPSQPISIHPMLPLSSPYPSSRHGSETNAPDLPRPLNHFEGVLPGGEAQNHISAGRFKIEIDDDKIIFLQKSHEILHERDTRKPFSDCSGELGNLELGNLPLADDTDDVIQYAVAAAGISSIYGHFSDLYYLQEESNQIEIDGASLDDRYEHYVDDLVSESAAGALETLIGEVTPEDDSNSGTYGIEMTRISEKIGVRSRSSFAARVEEKSRIATAAFLNGNRDVLARQEQQEDTLTHDKEDQHNRKPHLTLKLSPILCGESSQSSWNPPHTIQHPFDGLGGVSVDFRKDDNKPTVTTQSGQSPSAESAGPNGKASTIDLSTLTVTSSRATIYSPLAPPFHQGQPESITMIPASICNRYATDVLVNPTSEGITSIRRGIGRQDTLVSDTSQNGNTSLPHADHSTIGVAKAATTSTQTLISPASATSTVSTASVGSTSVKDKVRQLEERVKATISL